jgi:hypothetical protein
MNKQAAYELGVQLALRDAGITKEAFWGLLARGAAKLAPKALGAAAPRGLAMGAQRGLGALGGSAARLGTRVAPRMAPMLRPGQRMARTLTPVRF